MRIKKMQNVAAIFTLLMLIALCSCHKKYDTFGCDESGCYIRYANEKYGVEYFDYNKETGGFYKNGVRMILSSNHGKMTYFPDSGSLQPTFTRSTEATKIQPDGTLKTVPPNQAIFSWDIDCPSNQCRVAWKAHMDSIRVGECVSCEAAQGWVDKANKEYPGVRHWVEK